MVAQAYTYGSAGQHRLMCSPTPIYVWANASIRVKASIHPIKKAVPSVSGDTALIL